MQQPKMIVLGLIAQGLKYGLEMQKQIDQTNMRLWAQIGGSTIYKTLRDLEAEGCVTSRAESAARGPGKTVYSLTRKGKKKFDELVSEALSSRSSVYSDRIAGMVLAVSLPKSKASRKISESALAIESALDVIRQTGDGLTSPIAKIVLDYYQDIYKAERRALKAMLKEITG